MDALIEPTWTARASLNAWSASYIRSSFGAGPDAFAFPFTDEGVGREFFESAFSTGGLAVSFASGSRAHSWPRNLRRTMMDHRDGSASQVLSRLASGT